ncbi:DNA-directed RNA polymerase subunit beta [Spiroplasma endosymbiont of Labia minor]|uniref:DNA-directed RNA polymerase subunit beta n=1 Tax=Spiroplasma endosymbiont of Labia minor TaxID=3066305 RepID=UPI0030CFFD78
MSYKVKKINKQVERRDYAKVSGNLQLPNLIELQIDTFNWFIKDGINEVFNEVFPILSADGDIALNLSNWQFKESRMKPERAKSESKIYDAPIYADLNLTIKIQNYDIPLLEESKIEMTVFLKDFLLSKVENASVTLNAAKGNLYFYDVKTKNSNNEIDKIQIEVVEEKASLIKVNIDIFKVGEVFFGEFPLMTDRGTFIINGSEKVVVSQLVRSPGSYFKRELNRKNGEMNYFADIIPSRGTWLEFETDIKRQLDSKTSSALYVKIDKSRKATATSLLQSFGMTKENVLNIFDSTPVIKTTYDHDVLTDNDHINFENQVQEIYKKIRQGETATTDGASKYIYGLLFDQRKYDLTKAGRFKLQQKLAVKNRLLDTVLAEDLKSVSGKILFTKGTEITKKNLHEIGRALEEGAMVEEITFSQYIKSGNKIQKVRVYKNNDSKEESIPIIGVYGESKDEFLNVPDIIATISYCLNYMDGIGEEDDIDHLGNRRVRTVGELLQNQFRIGMMRIEKNVKEKISSSNPYKIKPWSIVNNKPLTAIIGEFFNLSQLSQFMDQTNPLAELTNKRRLTALGPGGLSRERAGLEVRDVHPSHYGRICPIETPEGPNIGLISNLSTFARINEFGFIESPYRKVIDGVVKDNVIDYLTADQERDYTIAQASVSLDAKGKIKDDMVIARYRGDDLMTSPLDVDYIDVSPKQIVSIAASCIPFLENDDANRALMGANMQRQAVPLINPESPLVGTGVEFEAARDSGAAVVALQSGIVKYVDSKQIKVEGSDGTRSYFLADFKRSNSGTSITHSPCVKLGDQVDKGQIIADGPSMEQGELALGQNIVVAFTTYNGYNYEDAVIVSERVVMEDRFTSIHIDEYTIERRQTKQGQEEITREIPNVAEAAKKNLDMDGIVRIGAEVKVGDILVGKITPKGQTQLSPEDRLLHAIFGEKSRNVKDNSLRVPNGGDGIVQSIKRFTTNDFELPADIKEIIKICIVQKRKIQEGDKMSGRHGNKGVISKILPVADMPHLEDGTPVDILLNPQGVPSRMNIGQVLEIHLGMAAKRLGIKVSTPVFEGLSEEELNEIMTEAGMTDFGKVTLIDGRTGEKFDKPIAVGVMYMLKLSHMVDDKLHARNVGPYSLITQQPLGGKAQNGGQRFGEMEVWALEAYGAAHTLREILTIKSDDIKGRIKTYEAIVRNKQLPQPGIPESFNVLTKEIMGLGFDMYMINEQGEKVQINAYDEETFDYDNFSQSKNDNFESENDAKNMMNVEDFVTEQQLEDEE